MRRNKKVMLILSFCLGATIFATTAFADITSNTGYDQLKNAIKLTAEACSDKFASFTFDAVVTLKDNDKVLNTSGSTQKTDNAKGMMISSSYSEYPSDPNGNKISSFTYRDKDCTIWNNSSGDTYYVTEYDSQSTVKLFDNPFKDERAKDVERIFDALIGNLKDYVVVDAKSDGSKELWGTLNDSQIPALVNAISSFVFKQAFPENAGARQVGMPERLDDVFIKNVNGKAVVNKDGIIERVLASGTLSGKDKDGVTHDITVEILGKIYDINTTIVKKPDLTGKNVEKTVARTFKEETIPKKFVGKYKNDIIIDKEDNFVKIGERHIEIVSIDDKHISGRYYESYKDGYQEYAKNKNDFRFDAEVKGLSYSEFEYKDDSGRKQTGSINFDMYAGKVYFNISVPMEKNGMGYDPSFSRTFND